MMSTNDFSPCPVTTEYVLPRVSQYPDGSVYLHKTNRPVLRWVISLTDHKIVDATLEPSVSAVISLGTQFARLNPALWERLIIGWWRNDSGELYLDLGMTVPTDYQAIEIGLAFAQMAAAYIYAPYRAKVIPLQSPLRCPHCCQLLNGSGDQHHACIN